MTRADYEQYFKHTQYHWILGLRTLSHSCQPNLWEQINGLTEEDITTIRQRQDEIKQKVWLVRSIYWIFNIHSYAEQYYQLLAYDELHALLSDEERMPQLISNYFSKRVIREPRHLRSQAPLLNPTPTDRPAPSGWSWALSLFGVNDRTAANERTHSRYSQIKLSQRFFGKRIVPSCAQPPAPEMSSIVEDSSPLPQQQDPTLTVQTSLLDSLALLALTKTAGETLSMAELKLAYRAQALAFHPDKNPSPEAQTQFIRIANAYEILKSIMEGQCAVEQETYNNYTDIWRQCDELSRDFEELTQNFRDLANDFRDIGNDFREIRNDFMVLTNDFSSLHDDFVAIRRNAEELTAEITADTARQRALVDQTDRDIAETNQFIAELHARRSSSPT